MDNRKCLHETEFVSGEETCIGYGSPHGHEHNPNRFILTFKCRLCGEITKYHAKKCCPACKWPEKDSPSGIVIPK